MPICSVKYILPHDSLKLGFAVKVKHGDLLAAIKERGWGQADLARYLGISQQRVGALINLRIVPRRFTEDQIKKLVALTGKLPEDLFPEWISQKRFQEAPRDFELYRDMTPLALEQASVGTVPTPEELMERRELLEQVEAAFKDLTPAQAVYTRAHLVDGKTIAEIAAEHNRSTNWIRICCQEGQRRLKESVEQTNAPTEQPSSLPATVVFPALPPPPPKTIGDLRLRTFTMHALCNLFESPAEVPIGDLLRYSLYDLFRVKGLGVASISNIEETLGRHNIYLRSGFPWRADIAKADGGDNS